jgi:hypothetical protein
VEIAPCPFTRWCAKQQTLNLFPGYFGIVGTRGNGRHFVNPGNPQHVPCTIDAAFAGAVEFARQLRKMQSIGIVDMHISAALGRRP